MDIQKIKVTFKRHEQRFNWHAIISVFLSMSLRSPAQAKEITATDSAASGKIQGQEPKLILPIGHTKNNKFG
jgi:hypothetical protein